ncbi:unnamed protein product [Pleuronectes platessa]|uniref:Uncharacterized protein n=1 Tax=Pleuronectes platessa TaxID=8262 RepID=A0A9N7UIH5_PLEPL|nr:unnamed protein product [Pleuronectes platessa]
MIQIQALLPPKLVVSTLSIRETDTVTLDCQCPPGAFQCYLYTEGGQTKMSSCQKTLSGSELLLMAGLLHGLDEGYLSLETEIIYLPPSCREKLFYRCYFYTEGGPTKMSSCQKTLSGRELLMAGQSSPAEVKVKCFYTVRSGNGHSSSPHSEISSIAIQTPLPPKLVVSTSVITETDTVTLDCQCPTGVFQCYFYTEGGQTPKVLMSEDTVRERAAADGSEISSITIHKSVEIESHTMQTTQFPMTSGPPASTPVTSIKGLTVSTRNPMGNVISTLRTPGEVTSALTVTTSRNAKEHVSTSSPTPEKPDMRIWTLRALGATAAFGVTVGFISLGLTFHCTTRKSGNEKPNKQEPQNEQSVIYHKYDTISEEPPASAPTDMVYSTLQPV